jgi:hypothetical protein
VKGSKPEIKTTYRVHQGDNTEDKLTAQQTTGRDQRNPSRAIDPASDPGQDWHPASPGGDSNPVVLASGSRVSGKELGQGSGHTQVTDTRCNQACQDSCQFCAIVPIRNRCIPQTTLALPPEVRLRDRLADNAVHDCAMSIIDSLAVQHAD